MRFEAGDPQRSLAQGEGIIPVTTAVYNEQVNITGNCVVPLGVGAEKNNQFQGKLFLKFWESILNELDDLLSIMFWVEDFHRTR